MADHDNPVNHSLDRRRDARGDARDQQHEMVTQTTNATVETAKIIIRFQADLLMAFTNNMQVLTRAWVAQLDAFTADAERMANYTQQTGQRG